MKRGQKTMDFQIPLASDEPIPYAMQIVLIEVLGEGLGKRKIVLAESPVTQFLSAGNFNDVGEEGQLSQFQAKASPGATLSLSRRCPSGGLAGCPRGRCCAHVSV